MCAAMYEVLAAPVEAEVWNTRVGIALLKREKGELMNGAKTRV